MGGGQHGKPGAHESWDSWSWMYLRPDLQNTHQRDCTPLETLLPYSTPIFGDGSIFFLNLDSKHSQIPLVIGWTEQQA